MSILASAATVGGMTMISRVLGFARDVLIAAALGTGPVADAFFVAFRFPNLFRRLFAEGAFNSAFVPLFAKKLEGDGPEVAREFGNDAMSGLLFVLLIVSAVIMMAMPWLMVFIAPGFSDDPEKYDLAVLLTRIAFPYLTFMSLAALLSGVLNSMNRFLAAAAAPILLNVVLIGTLLAIVAAGHANSAEAGVWLVWGVSAAGALQLVTVYVAAARAGMVLGLRGPRLTPDVKRLVTLGIPGVIAGGITQVNILVGTIIASLQDSAVSFLYYADRIYQLPLGVVGIAIGIVLLPDLSRRLRAGDVGGADTAQNRACEIAMLLTVPAAAALAAMPVAIVTVLFERGAFTADDTLATAHALAAFAAGLPAFVLIKVFSPGFFAREDTRTPMIFAGIGMAVNVVGSLSLFFVIGHVGIAIATSAAGWVNAGLLMVTLARRGGFAPDRRLMNKLPRILAASLIMGAVLWIAARYATPFFSTSELLVVRAGALACIISIGLLVFWGAAELTGAARLREMRALLASRSSAT